MSTPPVGPEWPASSEATTAEPIEPTAPTAAADDSELARAADPMEPDGPRRHRRRATIVQRPSPIPPRAEVMAALTIAAVAAVLGAPLGLLWWVLAPQVELIKVDGGVYPLDSEPEGYFADDGWFMLLGAGAGVLLAAAAWMVARRYRGPIIAIGLVIGSAAGGVLAAWLGHRLGLSGDQRLLRDAPAGTHLHRPVNVRIADVGLWLGFLPRVRGVVLIPAFAAASMYTILAAINPWPSLREDEHVSALADALDTAALSSGSTGPPAQSAGSAPPAPATAAPPPDAAAFVRPADD